MNHPNTQFPVAVSANIVVQEMGDETLIYKLDTHQYFHLNSISNLVWHHCDGNRSVERIAADIQPKLGKKVTAELVWLNLDTLRRAGLIIAPELAPPDSLRGLNRRQMIREIGLTAGAVALPMVAAMIAPAAVNAQSSGGVPGNVDVCTGQEGGIGQDERKTPNGGLCNGNGNCCSNKCCPLGNGQGVCVPAGQTC